MKVFVTGGTGFIGAEVLEQLKDAGHDVRALVRPGRGRGAGTMPGGVEVVEGDVLDEDLAKHLSGMDAVIHLVGIIRSYPGRGITFQKLHVEAARNVLEAMKSAGVERLIHMSALGAEAGGVTEYFRTKYEAENLVKESGLKWTVMKPSVVYGPRDQFVNMLAKQVEKRVTPVIGDGKYLLQPVSVKDVASGFVKSLTMDDAIGRTYQVGGPDRFTYNDLLDVLARALGRKKANKVHLPLVPVQMVTSIMERFDFFPVTQDQLKMLLKGNVCDPEPYFTQFGIEPVKFEHGIKEYVGADSRMAAQGSM